MASSTENATFLGTGYDEYAKKGPVLGPDHRLP